MQENPPPEREPRNPAASFDARLARMFRCSRFARRLCEAQPALVAELQADGGEPTDIAKLAAGIPALTEADALDRGLRDLRRRAMARLIFRDVNGLAPLEETLAAISALATQALQLATALHEREVAIRFGLAEPADPRARLIVAGMGKLGGGELNASSDVDLIFLHREDGEAAGGRSWHEFHCEVGKRLIRSLDAVDAGGFVFRVDMRLRPFGASGPLVASLASLENYFITQARPWERYAWLKAKALTGDAADVEELEQLVTPFVYRRYHDYGAIDDIRSLHAQIRAEAARKRMGEDIKLGAGGIRELEFVAQMFQLIRGGREPALRTRSTREALMAIGRLGILPADRVAALQSAYAFLRHLEHRLQYLEDAQTQSIPSAEADREAIAEGMGFAGWAACAAELAGHRATVTREFDMLFAAPRNGEGTASIANATGDLAATCRTLAINAGLDEDEVTAIAARVESWLRASRTQSLSAKSRARLDTLIPLALEASLAAGIGATSSASATFFRVFDLMEAIDRREAYLALLVEYPAVLARVTGIAARSAFAAEYLKKHPVLMDELLDAREAGAAIDWEAQKQKLRADCDHAEGDVERQYEILRHTKHVLTLKLNVADLDGRLGVMALSDELTALAGMLVDATLTLAGRALGLVAPGVWSPWPGFAVLAYGKFGSKELGYASDLDLVFIAGDDADGAAAARLAQRTLSWLNTMTAGGVLYDTDLRLRPDGDSGVMVPRLAAFADYQATRAWTWEHQALTRARWCAGDPALAAPFDAIRANILSAARNREKLKAEIVAMRNRMRAEKKDGAERLDLKHTLGGMVDVEFIVQYLILACTHEHPEFLGNLGNFALLARAATLGLLDARLADQVGHAYLAFRERQHRARTNNELKTWIGLDELAAEREAVKAAWQALLG